MIAQVMLQSCALLLRQLTVALVRAASSELLLPVKKSRQDLSNLLQAANGKAQLSEDGRADRMFLSSLIKLSLVSLR